MARLPRIERVPSNVQVPARTGRPELFGSLAERLQRFADGQQDRADREAARQGKEEGMRAGSGKTRQVELAPDDTIRGRAFNEGALLAHGAAVQTDIRSTVARIEQEHPNDPQAFTTKLQAYREGLFEDALPQMQPFMEQELADYASAAAVRIEGRAREQIVRENLAEITTAAENMTQDVLNAARTGNDDLQFRKRDQLHALWDEGVDTGVLDPAQVAKWKADLSEQADAQALLGAFEDILLNEGHDAAQASLAQLRKNPPGELNPDTRDAVVTKMEVALGRERSRLRYEEQKREAAIKARERAIAQSVDDAELALDNGFIPPDLEQLFDQARGTQYEGALRTAIKDAAAATRFGALPLDQQAQMLREANRTQEMSGAEVRRLQRFERIHKNQSTKFNRDPLGFAVEKGVTDQMPALDMSNAEAFVETLRARVPIARQAEAHFQRPVPVLTAEEADGLGAMFGQMELDQRLGTLGAMVDALGAEAGPALALLDKANHGLLATAGGLMVDGVPGVARQILMGAEQAKENPKLLPADADVAPVLQDYLGHAYADNPRHRANIVRAAKSVYAQVSANEGDFSGMIDSDRLEQALQAVTGGVVEWGGIKTEAPAYGVDQDQFEEWIEGLKPADIELMGGVAALSAEEALEFIQDEDATLRAIGRGRYLVQLRTGFLSRSDGEPFELEFQP